MYWNSLHKHMIFLHIISQKKYDIFNTTKILTKIFQWCHQHEIDGWSLGFDPLFFIYNLNNLNNF